MAEENNPAPANAPEEKNQDWTDMIEVRDRGNAASVSGDGDSKILNQEEIDTLFGRQGRGRRRLHYENRRPGYFKFFHGIIRTTADA